MPLFCPAPTTVRPPWSRYTWGESPKSTSCSGSGLGEGNTSVEKRWLTQRNAPVAASTAMTASAVLVTGGLKLLPVETYSVSVAASKVGVLQMPAPVAPPLRSASLTVNVCQSTRPSAGSASTSDPLPPWAAPGGTLGDSSSMVVPMAKYGPTRVADP